MAALAGNTAFRGQKSTPIDRRGDLAILKLTAGQDRVGRIAIFLFFAGVLVFDDYHDKSI